MPKRLRGFISYSSTDRARAASVKDALSKLGVDGFMANDDIHISQEWRSRILQELEEMDVFVPLLSAAFKGSDWASQEVGYAVARPEVLIIPVFLDATRPYGFIAALQGRQLNDPINLEALRAPLAARFPRMVIGLLIDALAGASSFRGAEALFKPLLPYLGSLTPEEAVRLAIVATQNGEIWDAALCRTEYLPAFIAANRHQIPPEVLTPLEYQLEHNSRYDPSAEA